MFVAAHAALGSGLSALDSPLGVAPTFLNNALLENGHALPYSSRFA
jgi:hypothetical protein